MYDFWPVPVLVAVTLPDFFPFSQCGMFSFSRQPRSFEYSNEGAKVSVVALFGKAASTRKDGGGDEQRPRGPR